MADSNNPDERGKYQPRDTISKMPAFRNKIAGDLPWLNEPIQVAAAGSLHRVRLGPYKTREEALAIADKIRASLDFTPVITPANR